jgi:F1F0 ATPase subunit 2
MTTIPTMTIAIALAAGFAVGLVYFFLLFRTVRLHLMDGPTAEIIVLYGIRIVLVGVVFWLLVEYGALSLLVGFAGFLMARFAVRRIVRA